MNKTINIDKELLEDWKKYTFISGVWQLNHIKNVSSILNIFNEKTYQ